MSKGVPPVTPNPKISLPHRRKEMKMKKIEFSETTLTSNASFSFKEKIEIAATKVPAFKAGRALKDAVSE